jgi:hypothetical protein
VAARPPTPARTVDAFLSSLEHPRRDDIEALRRLVLSAGRDVGEDIKWNAPSFFTGEHFATMRLNGKVPLQLILHLGARKSALPPGAIDDPGGLLTWLGPDRACVDFAGPGDVGARADALLAILRQWLRHVPARATR